MTGQGTLQAGLIGAHIPRTRLPAALRLVCDQAAEWAGEDMEDDLPRQRACNIITFGNVNRGFNTEITEFVQRARAAGAQVITGVSLFKHMSLRNFQAFTSQAPDATRIPPCLDYLKPD